MTICIASCEFSLCLCHLLSLEHDKAVECYSHAVDYIYIKPDDFLETFPLLVTFFLQIMTRSSEQSSH